jgi:hypothetical protein
MEPMIVLGALVAVFCGLAGLIVELTKVHDKRWHARMCALHSSYD